MHTITSRDHFSTLFQLVNHYSSQNDGYISHKMMVIFVTTPQGRFIALKYYFLTCIQIPPFRHIVYVLPRPCAQVEQLELSAAERFKPAWVLHVAEVALSERGV